LFSLAVVGLTLYSIYLLGGSGWLRHFGFPVCFILVSVSWPYRLEKSLTQGLMRAAASVTVEVLGAVGIPAMQHGNLIDLATGTVGVDEACSGIRSFQSTLMGALFLGELYNLSLGLRLMLLSVGIGIAFALNVCRTFLLSWQAARGGFEALHKWHDPAGFTIAIACFVCLWLLGLWLTRRRKPPATADNPSIGPASLPGAFTWAMAFCVIFVLLGKEIWYRSHEARRFNFTRWTVSLPTQADAFSQSALPKDQRDALKCDQEQGGSWEESGARWSLWWLRWNFQSMQSLVAARCHKPETCLPASGRRLQADLGLHWFDAGTLKIPFRRLVFENAPQPLYVFFCLWQDGTELVSQTDNLSVAGRLSAALNGRRKLGQQTLEIICTGYDSMERAQAALSARLTELIRLDPPEVGRTP
jgi:exosortase